MKSSKKLLVVFTISFAVVASIETMYPNTVETSYVVHSIFIAVLLFSWCRVHASENSIKPPAGAKLLAGLFPPVGIPYYLLKGFGFKQGSKKFLLGVLWFVFSIIVYVLTSLALLF